MGPRFIESPPSIFEARITIPTFKTQPQLESHPLFLLRISAFQITERGESARRARGPGRARSPLYESYLDTAGALEPMGMHKQ